MLEFKDCVKLSRGFEEVHPKTLIAAGIIANEYSYFHEEYPQIISKFVVTSVMDGKHSVNSLHYLGLALDIRTWLVTGGQWGMDLKSKFCYVSKNRIEKVLDCKVFALPEDTHIHYQFKGF